MPGAFECTCIQVAANALHYLMTHIVQVNPRKGHEAQGRDNVICLLFISVGLGESGWSMPRPGRFIPEIGANFRRND